MSILTQTPHLKSSIEICPQAVASALQDSLSAPRLVEKALFDSGGVASGLLLSQIKVILILLQHGKSADSGHFLSVLEAAKSVPGGKG